MRGRPSDSVLTNVAMIISETHPIYNELKDEYIISDD